MVCHEVQFVLVPFSLLLLHMFTKKMQLQGDPWDQMSGIRIGVNERLEEIDEKLKEV